MEKMNWNDYRGLLWPYGEKGETLGDQLDFIDGVRNGRGDERKYGDAPLTEPVRTLCSEIRENATVIPVWAWLAHGEEEPDSEGHHIDLENLPEEAFYCDRHKVEDDKEAIRDPLANQAGVVQAGARLMDLLGLSNTRAMCGVVGFYLSRTKYGMDAVIDHLLSHKDDKEVVEAAIEFAGKMANYFPEISEEARKRLVKEMRKDWKRGQNDGSAFRFQSGVSGYQP